MTNQERYPLEKCIECFGRARVIGIERQRRFHRFGDCACDVCVNAYHDPCVRPKILTGFCSQTVWMIAHPGRRLEDDTGFSNIRG